jgi:hypothetical protein
MNLAGLRTRTPDLRGWMHRRRRTIASTATLSVVGSAFLVAAAMSDGVPVPDVALHDGSVWVTNSSELLVGRLNRQIDELSSGLRAGSVDFDVLQQGTSVLVQDRAAGTLQNVDPAYAVLGQEVALPADAEVYLGGTTVGVLRPEDGAVWVRTVDAVATLDVTSEDPDARLGPRGRLVVGQDGTAHAVSVDRSEAVSLAPGGEPRTERIEPRLSTEDDAVDLTAVGDRAIVLDRDGGRIVVPGDGDVAVEEAAVRESGALLQQAGPASDSVLVSTGSALFDVPLDGGATVRADAAGEGAAARPVRVGRCAHAAWAGAAPSYAKACAGEEATVVPVPQAGPTSRLVFRVNRDVVVLNDVQTGNVWLLDDAMTLVQNWTDVTPPQQEQSDEEDDSLEEQVEAVQAERSEENRDPTAADDVLGVRPGRSTLLPLLDNDSDPDGDLLTIDSLTPEQLPSGTPQLVAGGRSVQLAVPGDATGTSALSYTVADGRGGSATATATVTVRPYGVNEPPIQLRRSAGVVEQGGSVTVRVLGDFRDPDGDDLVLVSAAPTTADTVRFRPDGEVTFVDSGTAPGRKKVTLVVSDGRETAEGELTVDVRPAGQLPPVPSADHVVTYVGRSAVVKPLVNDTDPNGDELRLSRVDAPAVLQARTDSIAGTFTLAPQTAGSYYVTYVVTDGPGSAVGLVRVDVLEPATANRPPVAVRDQALLPDGGRALVDVLVNDEDPDGDVLVVQQVTGAAEQGLVVAVQGHRVMRISATRALTEPVTIGYVVSDGQQQATGSVVVVPVPRPAQQQPPVAVPDTATVRAGDVVSIPVLANDSHPDGDDLTLRHELAQDVPDGRGLLFVDGSVLRFQAPDEPGTVQALYTIADSQGQTASTQVTIYVRPADPENNAAPQPVPLVSRTLAGSSARIVVPLAGIDADGDSVTLLGIDRAPTKGRVTALGTDWFTYEAFPGASGTDEFGYAVADRLGARAVATVRIGIAPRTGNQEPVAVDDVAVVRAGRTATVPVLANDSDPDGDVLRFGDPALRVPAGAQARTSGESAVVDTDGAEVVTVPYTVEDGRGGRATAYVTVEARDDAPLQPPIARDDTVGTGEIADRTTVDVRVLDNDTDPDGRTADLEIGLPERSRATAEVSGSLIRVRLTAAAQLLSYSLTDADGLVAHAFIRVPGADDGAPALRSAAAVEVVQGESVEVGLDDVVVVRSGRSPRLTTEARVSATNGDGSALVVDESTLRYTSAPTYAGPASLSFEVTDGSGPDDPQGRTAVLTLPVTVKPGANRPPVWNGAELRVSPGEDAAVLDLRTAVTDPDPDDAARLRFTGPSGSPSGLTASVDGTRLSVTADAEVRKGTTATLQLSVTDGHSEPVAAPVTVSVTASTRPLAKAVDDVVADADQGETVSVDVLANDSNPFPDEPLQLTDAVVETGTGRASVSGDQVQVTPGGDFVGTMVVRYTVQDATGDLDRRAEGRVRVTVRGKPARPAAPTVLEVRDRTVVLTWSAPAANGAPITSYLVQAAGISRECPSTTCTLDGLTNDVEYRFTVTARNDVGDSDPSPESAPARPDVRPDRPNPPTLVFGDRSLRVTWTAPNSPGSRIESYDLEISPAGAGSTQVTVSGTSHTWTGLSNGQSYAVRVRAENRAPEPSDWSDYSRPETPAGVPVTPAAPTAEPVGGAIGGQVDVRWTATDGNGDAVSRYDLQVFRGGSLVQTIDAGTSTQQTVSAENANDYSFRVVATNKAGASDPSPSSATVRPFGAPARIGAVQASEQDRQSTLSFATPSDNGKAIARYEYRINGGAPATLAADKVVGGLTNGQSYRFEVRACNDYCAEWSDPSNAAVPYGPVGQPGVSASGGATTVTFNWSPPAPNGRPISYLEYTINGGGLTRVGAGNGSVTVGNGHSQNYVMQIWAFDSAGQRSNTAQAGASTSPPPPRIVEVGRGASAVGEPNCSHSSCAWVRVTVRNFAPNTRYTGSLTSNPDNLGGSFTLVTDGNGYASIQTNWYYGYPNGTVTATVDGVSGSRSPWA